MVWFSTFCAGGIFCRARKVIELARILAACSLRQPYLSSGSVRLIQPLSTQVPEEGIGILTPQSSSFQSTRETLKRLDAEGLLNIVREMTSRHINALVAEIVREDLQSFPSSKLGELFKYLGKGIQASDSYSLQQLLDQCLERDDVGKDSLAEIADGLMFVTFVKQGKLFSRIILEFGERLVDFNDRQLVAVGKSFILQTVYGYLVLQESTKFTKTLLAEFARRIPSRSPMFAVKALGAAVPAEPDHAFVNAVVLSARNNLSSLTDQRFACLCRDLYKLHYKPLSFKLEVVSELLSRFDTLKPWQLGYGLLLLPKETALSNHLRKSLFDLLMSRPEDFQLATDTAHDASRVDYGRLLFFFSKLSMLIEPEAENLSPQQALAALAFAVRAKCCSVRLAYTLTKRLLTGDNVALAVMASLVYRLGSLFSSLCLNERAEMTNLVKQVCRLKLCSNELNMLGISQLCTGMKHLQVQHSEWCDAIASYLLKDFDLFWDDNSQHVLQVITCFHILGYPAPELFERLGEALDSRFSKQLRLSQKVELLVACALNGVFPRLALGSLFTELPSRSEEKELLKHAKMLLQLSTLVSSRNIELSAEPELPWPMVSYLASEARRIILARTVHGCLDDLEEFLGEDSLRRRLVTGRGQSVVAAFYLGEDNRPVRWSWLHSARKFSMDQLHRSQLQPVAVLAHPESEFLFDSCQPIGPLLLEERCLQACGWLTVVLPAHHWKASNDKHAFIETTLKNALC